MTLALAMSLSFGHCEHAPNGAGGGLYLTSFLGARCQQSQSMGSEERSCVAGTFGKVINNGSRSSFRAQPNPPELPMPDADYNVAPTTYQPIIRQGRETGERELILARWGLVPFFTKDLRDVKGLSTINARSETITKASTWREPFKKRRCLVPVSSFYEWVRDLKVVPMIVRRGHATGPAVPSAVP